MEQLQGALLTADEVNAIGRGTFTATPDNSEDDSNSGCVAVDAFSKAAKAAERAKAANSYDDQAKQLNATETLVYLPRTADAIFTALKSAIRACSSLTAGGSKLAVTVRPAPTVSGAADTLSAQATGQVAGQMLTVGVAFARVGDSVVDISYGGGLTPDQVGPVTDELLARATAKAQPVLVTGG
jgi:hypothetical protein